MLLASFYPSRRYNFEVATRFLENVLHLVYAAELLRVDPYCSELVKGESIPLQTWSGPEGSRKSRFADFMTTE